jgi:hypothetical protein
MRIYNSLMGVVCLASFAVAGAESVNPIQFRGKVFRISKGHTEFEVTSGSQTIKFLSPKGGDKAFRRELNGCPGASLDKLAVGDYIEGGFLNESATSLYDWAAIKQRDRPRELRMGVEGCITGKIEKKDSSKGVIGLRGQNDDIYSLAIDSETRIECGGDSGKSFSLATVPLGLKVRVRYLPRTPNDKIVQIHGLQCGGR